MKKLTQAKIELFWWKFIMIGFFLMSGDFLFNHDWVLSGLTLCFGLVVLEAVIECSNRISAIQRNRINGY